MSSRAILLGILALALAGSACRKKEEALSLLVWEGYADASFVQAFEQRHRCKVQASYMGSSDELVAKLRGGSASNYDVISPSSDVAASIVSAGLAAPRPLPGPRIPGASFGIPDTRERFRCGMSFPACTWPPRSSATTIPIPTRFTT